VPSTHLPLSHVVVGRFGEPSRAIEQPRLHWSPIIASASVSFALVVCVVAWIAVHPNKSPHSLESARVAVVENSMLSTPQVTPVITPTPAFHRAPARETIADNLAGIEEELPPLPPPPSPRPKPLPLSEQPPLPLPEERHPSQPPVVEAVPPQPPGETYGTQVLFMNNREAAADLARRDRKLLFVMHISGNFEDSCFT
jgi:hypothetical protein